jgi:fluoride exporter
VSDLAWAGVLVLGGLGAIARFLLDAVISQRVGRDFPVGTLAINMSGAFVLGLLTGVGASGDLSVLAGTATIGSFTTFSTWMLETHRLVEDGERRYATVNIVISLVVGVLAAAAGRAIGTNL